MLLLIEPPGAKHQGVAGTGNRPGQHHLAYSTAEDEDADSDDVPSTAAAGATSCAQVFF